MANQSSEYELAIKIAGMVEKSLGNSIKETQNQIGSIGNIAQKAANMIGTAFAAIKVKDFVVDCAQSAMSFEETMSDVAKVVDGLKDSNGNLTEEYYAMSDSLIEMSKKIPLTTDELGQITAAAGQANIAKEDLMQFTETAAKMGVAFDTTAEQAGTWMATWRTALNLTQDEVETLGDQINYLGNTSSENALKLSQIVNDIGSLAKISGVSGAELAALGAATTGIDANVAATGLKNMFVAMGSGKSATDTQIGVLQKLGFTATDLAERMQVDAQGAIMDLLGAINKLPAAEQEAAIKDYFGKESLATVAVLSANLDNLKSQFDETKYAGSMEAEYQAKAVTTANSIQLLKNRWEALKIQLGNYLLPMISKIVEYMSSSVDSISAYIEANSEKIEGFINKVVDNIPTVIETCKSLIPVLAGIAGAFVAFKGITSIMAIAKSFSKVIGVIKNVIFAFQAFAGGAATLGEAIAFVCNPVGLVIAAIAGFIAIIVALYTKNEEFRNKVNEIWNGIKESILSVFDNIKAKIAEHQGTIDAVVAFVQNVLGSILIECMNIFVTRVGIVIETIGAVINGVIDFISGVITIIEGICNGDWSKVWDGIKEVVKGAVEIITGLWNGLIKLLSTPINAVVNLTKKVFGGKDDSGEETVKVGNNATGTKSWRGGLTYVNEGNRGELIDLPNGTQITSHSQTESLFNKIANAHAEKNGSSIARLVDLLSGNNATENNNIDNWTNQEPVIHYSPQFIFQGEAPSKNDMVEAARMSKDEFARMMKDWQRDNKRIKLA